MHNAESKSWLSTSQRGYTGNTWMGHSLVLGFAREFPPESNSVQTLYPTFPSDETINRGPVSISMQKDHVRTLLKYPVVHVRIRWIMETLKHPACIVGWIT